MRFYLFSALIICTGIDIIKAQTTFWPLSNSSNIPDVMTSPFGPREFGSILKYQMHWGLDFRGNRGDPVYSIVDGIVKTVGRDESRTGSPAVGSSI